MANIAGVEQGVVPLETFTARFLHDGARIMIDAPTLASLCSAVSKFRPTESVVQAGTVRADKPAPTAGKPKADAPKEAAASSSASAQASEPKDQPSAAAADKPSSAKTEAAASEKPAGDAFDYEVLKKAVHKLAAKAPDRVVAINKELGVKTMKELSEDRWPAAYAKVKAVAEELEVAL